jgi:hypothetical protein
MLKWYGVVVVGGGKKLNKISCKAVMICIHNIFFRKMSNKFGHVAFFFCFVGLKVIDWPG